MVIGGFHARMDILMFASKANVSIVICAKMIDHGERVKQEWNSWLSNEEYSKRKPTLNGESEISSNWKEATSFSR